MQSLVEMRLYTGEGVRNRSLVFFVCLFVCLSRSGSWTQRFSHSHSDIVAICRSILMRISTFFRGKKCSFKHLRDIWTIPQGGATFILELGQNLIFFENSKGKVCVHDFDHLGEGQKKIPQQPISSVIVDVHQHKIFRFHSSTIICQTFKCGPKSGRKWLLCAHHVTETLWNFNATFYAFVYWKKCSYAPM